MVVPVGDPGFACKQRALLFPPLVVRRFHPARLPVMEVEMNHWQASLRRERTRERALPGPGHPRDEDAATNGTRCVFHQAQCPRSGAQIASVGDAYGERGSAVSARRAPSMSSRS